MINWLCQIPWVLLCPASFWCVHPSLYGILLVVAPVSKINVFDVFWHVWTFLTSAQDRALLPDLNPIRSGTRIGWLGQAPGGGQQPVAMTKGADCWRDGKLAHQKFWTLKNIWKFRILLKKSCKFWDTSKKVSKLVGFIENPFLRGISNSPSGRLVENYIQ